MGISQQQTPTATSQIAQDVLEQAEMILHVRMNATQAYIMYKTYYEKKLTPQNWKDNTMGMSYTPKQVIRETNFFWQIFGSLALTLSKRLCPITNIYYVKSERTKRRCIIAWDYDRSRPGNSYPRYKPRQ